MQNQQQRDLANIVLAVLIVGIAVAVAMVG